MTERSQQARLLALVGLLGDDRERIREAAESALRAESLDAATLRDLVEQIEEPAVRSRARARIETLRTQALERELELLVARGADLETGAFMLARFVYPELDVAEQRRTLDSMAQDLRARIAAKPEQRACAVLRELIHDERGFKGDVETYADPENVFLNRVLARKTGIPTSLACIYLLVARRLGLALEPVNLPLHFLVRFTDEQGETFIDAFARGRFLSRADCREFLREAGLAARPEYLVRATDRAVLARLARCLIASYRSNKLERMAERFERCLQIVGDPG